MSGFSILGVTQMGVLLTSGTGGVVVEGIAGALLILIGYHYMQLVTGEEHRDQQHRRRLLQMFAALSGFAYFTALLAPAVDAWPVHLGAAIQLELGRTVSDVSTNLSQGGFVGWLYRLGLAVYVLIVTSAAVAIRIPVVLWQALVRN